MTSTMSTPQPSQATTPALELTDVVKHFPAGRGKTRALGRWGLAHRPQG